LLAVLMLMLLACLRALLADVGTELTELLHRSTVQRHKLRRQATGIRALHIQPDALAHHLHIFLIQTGRCAVVARGCAQITGLHAAFIFIRHVSSLH